MLAIVFVIVCLVFIVASVGIRSFSVSVWNSVNLVVS